MLLLHYKLQVSGRSNTLFVKIDITLIAWAIVFWKFVFHEHFYWIIFGIIWCSDHGVYPEQEHIQSGQGSWSLPPRKFQENYKFYVFFSLIFKTFKTLPLRYHWSYPFICLTTHPRYSLWGDEMTELGGDETTNI